MADVADIVRISTSILAGGTAVRDFGRTLYLQKISSEITDLKQAQALRTVPVYTSASDVSAVGLPTDTADAGSVYFQQNPFPRNLLLGSWIASVQPTLIYSRENLSVTMIEALGDAVALDIGGNAISVDLDGQNTLADQATALETAINGAANIAGATVTVSGTRFVIMIPSTVDVGTDGFTASSSTDTLGLTGTGSVTLNRVTEAEDIGDALARIQALDNSFYWVVPDGDIATDADDIRSVVDWSAPQDFFLMFDAIGEATLTTNESTSIGAIISALDQNNVAAIYNGETVDHKAIAYAAVFSGVNFEQPSALITGKFKTLAGTTATDLTPAQRDELTRKRINYYVPRGAVSDTEEGTSFGTWIDVQFGLGWFQNAVRVAVYNALRSSPRLPQTESGVTVLVASIQGICEQAVRNGLLAPNQVTPATRKAIQDATGNANFDGFLSVGYLVYAGALAEQSQANREARKAPPITVWAKGSGAIHFVDISILFEG